MEFDTKKPIELEEGWEYMEEGIGKLKKILEGEQTEQINAEQYMMLYTTIYNMCTQKAPHDHSEQLYARYRTAFENYIRDKVLPALRDLHGEALLRALVFRWSNHKIMVRWLSRFFNYLDRYYIQRHSLHSLHDVGILTFRDDVYVEMAPAARDAVLKLIEDEREGEQVDTSLLRDVLGIFQEVGMGSLDCYRKDFEQALLEQTAAYYRRKAAGWIEEDATPEYLTKTEECLKAEELRVETYLHVESKAALLNAAQSQLLAEHQSLLLEKEHSGCAALLMENRRDDLARMFRLFSRLGQKGLEPMADIFRRHVEEQGLKLVRHAGDAAEARKERNAETSAAGAKSAGGAAGAGNNKSESGASSPEHAFIDKSIELHDTFQSCVNDSFNGSSLFHKALKEAFESFCNKQVAGATAAELMATYCDTLLRKGGVERLGPDAVDEKLDKVVRLLAYVSDKDLFSEFYRKRLGRRLLMGFSASEDAEKGVLTRLKQQCGQQFTSKMEGMVQDLQLAKEKERAFAEWLDRKNVKLPLEMNVTVLTTGFWPSYKSLEIQLPEEMMAGVEEFNAFQAESSNKMRRLTWQLGLGNVHIKASFDKIYELIMQPSQAAVLLAFNGEDPETSLSFQDLKTRTKLPDEDLTRVLVSLVLAKYKLLLKSPAGRTIGTSDTFKVNLKFADRARRIRVQLQAADDRRKVQDDVSKDRRHALDAAIVRIMKSRKALSHQQLVMEVVQQMSRMFQPDIKQIKRCIEGLIEREYLERDQDNQQLYKYMA